MGGVAATAEFNVFQDEVTEGDGGGDAADEGFFECPLHTVQGNLTVPAKDDEFTDHGVVVGGDGVAAIDMGVHANAMASGRVVEFNFSRGGAEAVEGVFGVDTKLDGVADGFDIFNPLGEGFP